MSVAKYDVHRSTISEATTLDSIQQPIGVFFRSTLSVVFDFSTSPKTVFQHCFSHFQETGY